MDSYLSGMGSIDLKIHRAGGEALKQEIMKFGRCNIGDAILTHAYNLPCDYHESFSLEQYDPCLIFKVINCYDNTNCLKMRKVRNTNLRGE